MMDTIDKKTLSERDICTKYITPAIYQAGWDIHTQVREEVTFTNGQVIVQGLQVSRGKPKRADYILYYKPNIPIAVIEAKKNTHGVGDGMQQALGYADMLDVPFVYSSNGDAFLQHDRTLTSGVLEQEIPLHAFPSPEKLWRNYCAWKNIDDIKAKIVTQDYYTDGSGKTPRYYQHIAINRTIEAITKGQDRILLVMATGTGKTFTAFQIIWRLWKSRTKKRILFLADRNILVDQTKTNDFKPFGSAMTKIKKRQADKSFEIYLSLYQAVTGTEEEKNIYKQFSPDFFDLIVVDECHRGSADEDSAWHEILEYFKSATHIGLTATPKETKYVSNIHYFGDPVYTYSLKQGIEDGFLAPYKVIRIDLDKDLTGWRPEKHKIDKYGKEIEDRIYNQKDFDRDIVLDQRTQLVARKVTEYLNATDRFDKTIVFCENIDHAERMRQALVNENGDLVAQNSKYVMRITGDNPEGKAELDNFILPESRYPVIATT
ncbi:MAG: DEAD/DEAH box helicase family protein, partial [ANME-2 cluster archaeon]|nr:DEAD/DEAH box helicase family protein [ANME-2 cluster archaeon]